MGAGAAPKDMMRTLKVGMGAPLELVGQISVRLDGKLCRTSAGFLREIGETLRFPSYYGSNWDAFEECVHDLEWLPDTQINLIVDNSDQMLAREPDRQLALFVDILREDAQWGRALTIWLDGASDSRISRACRPLVKD
jgi:RNAse (barnase) inhibitor barstar